MKRYLSIVMAVTIAFVMVVCPVTFATETQSAPDVKWVKGPNKVTVDDKAEFTYGKEYVYLNKEDTVKMMEYYGNPTTEIEMGSVYPTDENQSWFVIFEYHDSGHVDDKDKNDINADELLKSLKEGTAEGNKIRKEKGMPELNIEGWVEKPAYNESLHSIAWGTIYDSNGEKGVNYESKILSREGYVSATLVCSVKEFDQCKSEFVKIVNNFKFVEGKRYTDYVAGDKLSDLGLAALVLGGTAAAVKKGGLIVLLLAFLKKGWILLAAAFGFAGKKLGKKKDEVAEMEFPETAEVAPGDATMATVETTEVAEVTETTETISETSDGASTDTKVE